MSEKMDSRVRHFIFHELPLVTALFMKKVRINNDVALQVLHEAEDVAEMAEEYFHYFQVQSECFSIDNYYPWGARSVFSGKNAMQKKQPLTIHMFIASARAGRWLYQTFLF
ncbi:DUF1493 family protein [Atlantibacter hermannii]|uniref:DUF1493 family protein n=1 Tax=Atlantibacter hermannii TaxID=565 RepID=UPI0020746997|nr:DUF1493 family protein [Atlantibacter hermannii]